jgi:hypothetical protein
LVLQLSLELHAINKPLIVVDLVDKIETISQKALMQQVSNTAASEKGLLEPRARLRELKLLLEDLKVAPLCTTQPPQVNK